MTTYYFVRHGESAANEKGLFAGSSDVPLTEKGIQQAQAVAERIRDGSVQFDAVFASPLLRAFDTAKIIAGQINYQLESIKILPDLHERSAGQLELAPVNQIYTVSEEDIAAYGGETAAGFMERAASVFADIKTKSVGMENVLIVAHAGIYKMAIALNQDILPATEAYQIPPPPNATLLTLPI